MILHDEHPPPTLLWPSIGAVRSGSRTWLPSVGQLIRSGQALYRVDGEPVILLDGTTPAYRTLTSGIGDGPDVLALNRDLSRLGFDADGITDVGWA